MCSINLNIPGIEKRHAIINISNEGDANIESLSNNIGVYKFASLNPKNKIKL